MKIAKVEIDRFRGIQKGRIFFPDHGVIVGDNNTCKSTVLEAIDLVLGPDRMRKRPVVGEHDFYAGDYYDIDHNPISIEVEVVVIDLSDEQKRHFNDHIEWWDTSTSKIIDTPPPETIEEQSVVCALRVGFSGAYDEEEDDFSGDTYFANPAKENGEKIPFRTRDKRKCGFLYLRTLRTGSRALSLERGSLLDIILQISEIKPKMWEDTLKELHEISVADNDALGVNHILSSVQKAIRSLVPADWGEDPQIKVSDLTREHLRKTLSVFMSTGAKRLNGEAHIAPFRNQGTGTINTLVLSLLSLIADLKKNVIFAMEEPEIAIPPHTQKRIVNSVKEKSSQALFTSHSPYVLEEFDPSQIIVLHNESGNVTSKFASFTKNIKPKAYQMEFRKKYCEALLASRVLIAEGQTEYDAIPVAARRLCEINPAKYSSLEALGIAVINAESDSNIAQLSTLLRGLGKTTYAIYDKQKEDQHNKIEQSVEHPFESPEDSFEKLILNHTCEKKLKEFAIKLTEESAWPSHLHDCKPDKNSKTKDIKDALRKVFKVSKGSGTAAYLIQDCNEQELPAFITQTIASIKEKFPVDESTTAITNIPDSTATENTDSRLEDDN